MVAPAEKKEELTKRFVENAIADPERRTSTWDSEIRGFHVRLYPTRRKVYYFQYRNLYKATRKINIGVHGNISTEIARETAQQLALSVSAGQDPAAKHQIKKNMPTINIWA